MLSMAIRNNYCFGTPPHCLSDPHVKQSFESSFVACCLSNKALVVDVVC
jgi:hypothetical protein